MNRMIAPVGLSRYVLGCVCILALPVLSNHASAADSTHYDQSFSLYGYELMGLAANYEQLLAPHHALVGEAAYGFFGPGRDSWSVGLSYRYHFKPGLDGFFVGAFTRGGYVHNEFGMDMEEGGDARRLFDVDSPLVLVGLDVLGYRLQFDEGASMVFRVGYGVPIYEDFHWTPQPVDDQARRFNEGLFGLDLEVSTGFSW